MLQACKKKETCNSSEAEQKPVEWKNTGSFLLQKQRHRQAHRARHPLPVTLSRLAHNPAELISWPVFWFLLHRSKSRSC